MFIFDIHRNESVKRFSSVDLLSSYVTIAYFVTFLMTNYAKTFYLYSGAGRFGGLRTV